MICEECQKSNLKKILREADKAMERYSNKIRKERHDTSKQTKRK